MKTVYTLLAVLFLNLSWAKAQTAANQDFKYIETLTKRADKILVPLSISDSARYYRIRNAMVAQYQALNVTPKENKARLTELHKSYIATLSRDLSKAEVEKIKDGMTYNVLPVTYKAYQDMVPSLKDFEKQQILTWLTEARELAMDAGSSEEKHGIFGKYKGKINNYLSAQGYDIQKERKEWEQRIKAEQGKGK
jgi:hypothetical protein